MGIEFRTKSAVAKLPEFSQGDSRVGAERGTHVRKTCQYARRTQGFPGGLSGIGVSLASPARVQGRSLIHLSGRALVERGAGSLQPAHWIESALRMGIVINEVGGSI